MARCGFLWGMDRGPKDESRPAEAAIMSSLDAAGVAYIPRAAIGPFVVSVAIPGRCAVIDVDGAVDSPEAGPGDAERKDAFLRRCGLAVFRLREDQAAGWGPGIILGLPVLEADDWRSCLAKAEGRPGAEAGPQQIGIGSHARKSMRYGRMILRPSSAVRASRRERAQADYETAAGRAASAGMVLRRCADSHYRLCWASGAADIFPGNQRVSCLATGRICEWIPDGEWGLNEVVEAAIAAGVGK